MPEPLAFLSYTRKDDDFFGGYITSFRKMLENAVHVVSGDASFQVFQDVEGIVIGEDWEKKLNEVIHSSSFFIPMLSPLFFNSKPCREEVRQFLEYEQSLERNDLMLPIYFLTSARLEKEEERAKDPLATDIARRHMFDWREQAEVPLQEPAARKAILKLAGAIDKAIRRLDAVPRGAAPRAEAAEADPSLTEGVADDARRETVHPRTILWVDDNPGNNLWERKALESYGARFVLAPDTDSAVRKLREAGPFTAIISDMGRPGDRQAGFTLLSRVRDHWKHVPYFIYTAGGAARLGPVARLRGARGLTADPDALVEMVVSAIT